MGGAEIKTQTQTTSQTAGVIPADGTLVPEAIMAEAPMDEALAAKGLGDESGAIAGQQEGDGLAEEAFGPKAATGVAIPEDNLSDDNFDFVDDFNMPGGNFSDGTDEGISIRPDVSLKNIVRERKPGGYMGSSSNRLRLGIA